MARRPLPPASSPYPTLPTMGDLGRQVHPALGAGSCHVDTGTFPKQTASIGKTVLSLPFREGREGFPPTG